MASPSHTVTDSSDSDSSDDSSDYDSDFVFPAQVTHTQSTDNMGADGLSHLCFEGGSHIGHSNTAFGGVGSNIGHLHSAFGGEIPADPDPEALRDFLHDA
jgi:hypothetical protein